MWRILLIKNREWRPYRVGIVLHQAGDRQYTRLIIFSNPQAEANADGNRTLRHCVSSPRAKLDDQEEIVCWWSCPYSFRKLISSHEFTCSSAAAASLSLSAFFRLGQSRSCDASHFPSAIFIRHHHQKLSASDNEKREREPKGSLKGTRTSCCHG